MQITSSYGIEIKQMNKIFRPTVVIYNKALSFCVDAFEKEWLNIEPLDTLHRKQYAERLIHTTKNNKSKYNFDIKFYKMPTYIRRSVISSALGYLSSYHSNLDNWKNNGCKGRKPTFQRHHNQFPTFYKGNMYLPDTNDTVQLKLYFQHSIKAICTYQIQMIQYN